MITQQKTQWFHFVGLGMIYVVIFLAILLVPPISIAAWALNGIIIAFLPGPPQLIFLLFLIETFIISTLLIRISRKK